MGWFDWTIHAEYAHEFFGDAFLIAPIFGLSYLIQNRTDAGLPAVGILEPEPTVAVPDLTVISVAAQGVYFYIVFAATMVFAGLGILTTPRPWLLGTVLLTFAATAIGLFSRFGVFVTRILLSQFDRHQPSACTSLSPLYEAHRVANVPKIARGLWPDFCTLRTTDAKRASRAKIARVLCALTVLWLAFLILAGVLVVRLFWFTTIVTR